MNMMSSFNNFYNNLSSNGLFFFWIVVFLFIFLIFLVIVLVVKNNKLIKLLSESKVSNNQDVNVLDDNIEDNELVVEEVKQDINKEEVKEELKVEVKEEIQKDNVIEDKSGIKEEEIGPYKKNVLREMNKRTQTSPIHIEKKDVYDNSIYEDKKDNNIDTDVSGIDLGEDMLSPLEMMEDSYEVNDNMKFAGEIVAKMEEEIKPSNIELTDYEKKQEEEAIISYDELLKVKDKIYNITEDEETDEFIDELKSFRLDLQ